MLRLIKISFILVILIGNSYAQMHLNTTNLAELCACNPTQSTSIYLSAIKIKTIDPTTFTGLTSLQELYLFSN